MRTPLFLVVSIAFVATYSSSVPKSVLKVKVWYDIGFLRGEQIGTHAKAKEFIHASFGHVQHFMCSKSLGTTLETKLVDIEYMKGQHFKGTKLQTLKDMRSIIRYDKSGADVHVPLVNYCNGGLAYRPSICKTNPLAMCCLGTYSSLGLGECITHEIGHVLGIRHDTDIGCGQGSDKGHMSGHHRGWSTCSRREFEANYLNLRRRNNWCLKPAKSGICKKRKIPHYLHGPEDVGFVTKCPSPTYQWSKYCCCGNGCCWNKCTWKNPPDNCLSSFHDARWFFDSAKGYYFAATYMTTSVLDCRRKFKPKECKVETFLDGPKDFGGTCPTGHGRHQWGQHCCCKHGCCFYDCRSSNPPQSCLKGIPNTRWVKNKKKGNYIAVRNWSGSYNNLP